MTDEESFLAAICADPENDVPRLAFADWLQEHDRPERAEFVRAQVERHRLHHDTPLPEVRYETWEFGPPTRRVANPRTVFCVEPPPDDLAVGRLYRLRPTGVGPDGVFRYLGDYARRPTEISPKAWSGSFVEDDLPRAKQLADRERELLGGDRNEGGRAAQWSEPLRSLGYWSAYREFVDDGALGWVAWERGFLFRLWVSGHDWVAWADRITAALPLRAVYLMGSPQTKRNGPWRWFGNRERYQADDLDPSSARAERAALLKKYWPRIDFKIM